MSIENVMKDLTDAIHKLEAGFSGLHDKLDALLGGASSGGYSGPKTADEASKSPGSTNGAGSSDSTSGESEEPKVAGRKTYIYFKDTKTGAVIEKGEEVPTNDGATGVSKSQWEKLCDKHGLDPETGKKPEPKKDDDDLPSDDDDLPSGDDDSAESGDLDDLDLGLDDEPAIDLQAVKSQLMNVMKTKGRETVLKIFKKLEVSNADQLKPEDYQKAYDIAEKVLKGA